MSGIESSNLPGGGRAASTVELILGLVGAIASSGIAILFAVSQGSVPVNIFPLPGLYLIEIAVVGVLGLVGVLRRDSHPEWQLSPWIAAGILLAFVILGAWSIGFYLIPSMLALLGAALFGDIRRGVNLSRGVLWFFLAGLLQAAVILLLLLTNL